MAKKLGSRSGKAEYEHTPFAERQEKYKACLDEIAALAKWSPKDFIRDRALLTKRYSADKSSHIPSCPVAAIRPGTMEEVAAVVKVCAKYKVPMTPRGAGTGLEGAAIPYAGGLVIDTARLQTIQIDEQNACVWCGSGTTKLQLSKAVRAKGFILGPDPSSNPCIGGMVACSGSGMCTLRYGTTRENVIALRVVTPKGNIFQTRQVVRKSSAGLELTQLYIGSEGTLGVICDVCLRLFPEEKFNAGGVAVFPSTQAAVSGVVALKQAGVPHTLLRCELLNRGAVACSNSYCKTNLPEEATVLLEFTTNDSWKRDTSRDYKVVASVFKKNGAKNMRYIRKGEDLAKVWEARRGCHFSAMHAEVKKKGVQQVLSTDICVPLSMLAKCVGETEEDFAADGRPCIICAHISDGNFHVLIPYSDPTDFKKARQLEQRMVTRALKMGGTVSGEHGIGVGKVHHLVHEHGPVHLSVQEKIKKALDPDNIMNPGCFYPSQQKLYPTAHL